MTRPRIAMVLAAGLGTRMRPLTDGTAKPMLPLGGRPLLDHVLDRLAAAGVERAVINTHWRAERVADHVGTRSGLPEILVREEPALLDTGGSVAAVLADLGSDPFFVVNGDAFWLDGPTPALDRVAAEWTDDLDAVLLVQRSFQVHAEVGCGDFALDPWGLPRRPGEKEIVPYVYAGVQLLSPRLFAAAPTGAFSMNVLWDAAIEAGRLRAVVHDGLWFHLSTPPDLADAEAQLHEGTTSGTR